ncbi:MAG TPA: cytidine deaminase [Longimicrobiaceae bacterium]|nr:cytidine deaminase [Longimicrobiaceae bacterium]
MVSPAGERLIRTATACLPAGVVVRAPEPRRIFTPDHGTFRGPASSSRDTRLTGSEPRASLPREVAEMLLRRARDARARAYVPYSHFPVGAALLAEDGEVFTGCNVENASYGLTNCAERVAVGKAVSEGVRRFRAVAVVGPEDGVPCSPCGACRQVLYEFGPDMVLVTPDREGHRQATMREMLPGAFDESRLGSREPRG